MLVILSAKSFPLIDKAKPVRTCLLNNHETHIELAVDVFKTQDPALVLSLKDFLTVLPNPKCVEEVLTTAIYQLAEIDPNACRWLFRHSCYLEPELDLVEVAMKLAFSKLQNQGFVFGQDFRLEPDSRLQVSEQAKARLMVENSICDRLLIEEILQLR
jgi:hypothetical protein